MLTKSNQRISRRQFIKLSTAVAAGSLIAACAPAATAMPASNPTAQSAATSAPAGKIKISFQHWGNAIEAAGYTKALQAFMDKFPNIWVDQIYVAASSQYGQKLMTSLAGGTGPDVFRVEGGYSSGLLATQGSLLPLDLVYIEGRTPIRSMGPGHERVWQLEWKTIPTSYWRGRYYVSLQ